MAEKRAFQRKKKRLIVDFLIDGRSFTGFTRDLSFTGLFISSSWTPKVGERLSASLHLPDGRKVSCEGRVVRARRVPTAFAHTEPSGFSVKLSSYFEDYCREVGAL